MEQESGFFASIADSKVESEVNFTLIHSSCSGFSELFRTVRDGKFVVIKTLKPKYRNLPQFESLLRKEFEIGYTLDHPGICRTLSYEDIPEFGPSIVMEWIDGRSLYDLSGKEKLSARTLKKVLVELCDALEYLHSHQIIHRDLKPGNIMITHNGSNVKIIDFGLSDADNWKAHKEPAGTVPYAAPELMQGSETDSRSDIYSLGAIILEIGGRHFSRIASRCMQRDKAKRFQSVADVRQAIKRRERIPAFAAAIALVVLIIAAAIFYPSKRDGGDSKVDDITRIIIESQEG